MTAAGPVPSRRRDRDMTYLGFDYGARRIGVAVGQSLTRTARGLDTVKVRGAIPDWARITRHVETWQPDALVVGVPLDSRGAETDSSRQARVFGKSLSARYNLGVFWVNEFLTSESARQSIVAEGHGGVRDQKDQVAARLILETFLNDERRDREELRN